MKLEALCFRRYALALAAPFATAHQTLTVREGYLVWLRDASGRWGVGEAAPLPGFGLETMQECGSALRRLAELLPGLDWPILEPGAVLTLPDAAPPAARSGIECAWLDLAAQAAGLPLHQLLAHLLSVPRLRDFPAAVPVNATLGALPAALAAEQARQLAAQGFGTIKVKVGTGPAQADVERLAAVRAAVGPAVRIRADANGAWDVSTALEMLRQLAPLRIEYVEQPVAAQDVQGMAELARSSPVRLAADESVLTSEDAARVLAAGAAGVLVLKPMALGGLLPAARVAVQAWRQGVPVVVTTMLEGAVGRAAALHLAATLIAAAPAGLELPDCGLATGSLLRDDVAELAPPLRGRLQVPTGAGLGIVRPRMPQPGGLRRMWRLRLRPDANGGIPRRVRAFFARVRGRAPRDLLLTRD